MQMQPILVVDYEPDVRLGLTRTLSQAGYPVESAVSGDDALSRFHPDRFSMVITDADIAGSEDVDLLTQFKQLAPALPVILTTARGSINGAVRAMQQGASDYLLKPFSADIVAAAVKRVSPGTGVTSAAEISGDGSGALSASTTRVDMITQDAHILKLLHSARSIAATDATVLIQGESGTGKEILARIIHQHSRRANGPYIALNCAALPENLAESELFGHEKGAFTGAIARKAGKFELAVHGTLVLDEISEMPLPLQAKLLRVLQEREIDRVGGGRPVAIDARIIVISNVNLNQAVRAGRFRQDLYYRINVIPFTIPPLRERREDIPLLATWFLSRFQQTYDSRLLREANKTGVSRKLSAAAVKRLTEYDWPGNVRELENMLERTVLMTVGACVEAEDLFFEESGLTSDTPTKIQVGLTVREMERELIFKTLNEVRDNRTRAAELLGISIRTLRNKLNEYKDTEMPGEQQAAVNN